MNPRRLNFGETRKLGESIAIPKFYDFPFDFDAGASIYAEMYLADNAGTQTLTLQNHFYQWTTGWLAGESNGFTVAPGTGQITALVSAVYRVAITFGTFVNAANQTLEFGLFRNGIYQPDHSMHLDLPNTRGNSGAIVGILTLNAGDVMDLRVQNTTSAGKVLTIEDANLNCC